MKRLVGMLLLALLVAPALGAQQREDVGAPEGAPPPAGPAGPVWERPTAVLYDNGPFVNVPGGGPGGTDGSMLQVTALGMNTLGFGHQVVNSNRVADDFTVPAPGWQVTTITFFAYQTGSTTTSTMNAVNLQIWNGDPSVAGSAVVWGDTTTNRLASSTWSNAYRYSDTSVGTTRPIMADVVTVNTTLAPGTYWLDWQTGGTLSSGPWAMPITINGQAITGNGLQSIAGVWGAALDSGTGTPQQGFPFIIQGDPLSADLSITKTTTSSTVPLGGSVTYTLTVANAGPAGATGVVVTDTLPAGLTYVSNSCGATYAAPTLTWNVGSLANGANVTCDLTATVASGGTIQNAATVTSSTTDPVSTNNSGSATITGQQSVLEIPTLGAAGLALLGILLGIASIVLLRRRTA